MAHLIGASVDLGFVDKRRALSSAGNPNTHICTYATAFTTNASGTTSTLVGANPSYAGQSANVVRRGDKFRMFAPNFNLKEETVFAITNIQVDVPGAGTTTVTFSPAAKSTTGVGDFIEIVSLDNMMDDEALDRRLQSLGAQSYSSAQLAVMTMNDKVYALRVARDSEGI